MFFRMVELRLGIYFIFLLSDAGMAILEWARVRARSQTIFRLMVKQIINKHFSSPGTCVPFSHRCRRRCRRRRLRSHRRRSSPLYPLLRSTVDRFLPAGWSPLFSSVNSVNISNGPLGGVLCCSHWLEYHDSCARLNRLGRTHFFDDYRTYLFVHIFAANSWIKHADRAHPIDDDRNARSYLAHTPVRCRKCMRALVGSHAPMDECVRTEHACTAHTIQKIHCMNEIYTFNGFLHFHFKCHKLNIFYFFDFIFFLLIFFLSVLFSGPTALRSETSSSGGEIFCFCSCENEDGSDARRLSPLLMRAPGLNYMETPRNGIRFKRGGEGGAASNNEMQWILSINVLWNQYK